ncbi:MAG: hypothetical protein ABJD24_08155 [Acidimicrobiales bacterium]
MTDTTAGTMVETVTSEATVPITAPPTTGPPIARVLLVGDSTLLAVSKYAALDAFRGFDADYEAASCRTLGVPSCGDPPRPPNSVETIKSSAGVFDDVVIMAGYDEWWTTFPESFGQVVAAARAKGARRIIWLTYREGVTYRLPDERGGSEAYLKNNATIREMAASGFYPDLVIADWNGYTTNVPTWLARDGIHLNRTGAYGVADYISRVVAHTSGRACPLPREAGGTVEPLCPNPDATGPPADVVSLYG